MRRAYLVVAGFAVLSLAAGAVTAQCRAGFQIRGHMTQCCGTGEMVLVYSCVTSTNSHCNFLARQIQCTLTCSVSTAASCTAADIIPMANSKKARVWDHKTSQSKFVDASCPASQGDPHLRPAAAELTRLDAWLVTHGVSGKFSVRLKSGR